MQEKDFSQTQSGYLHFSNPDDCRNGAHMEAFFTLLDITEDVMRSIRMRTGKLRVLDFGTGRYGAGRAILEPRMNPDEELALYDPSTRIAQSFRPDIAHTVSHRDALEYTDGRFNLVNISYVLCFMEPKEARIILARLAAVHPNASFLITDYVLQGREKLLALLDANEEKKWRERMGNDEFARTHTRFSPQSLQTLVIESGVTDRVERSWYLDKNLMRETILTEPDNIFCY